MRIDEDLTWVFSLCYNKSAHKTSNFFVLFGLSWKINYALYADRRGDAFLGISVQSNSKVVARRLVRRYDGFPMWLPGLLFVLLSFFVSLIIRLFGIVFSSSREITFFLEYVLLSLD